MDDKKPKAKRSRAKNPGIDPNTKKPLTEERLAHLRRIGVQKGEVRNPKGRPPIPAEIKNWMANKTEEAVETLYEIMKHGANDAARVKAAEYFLAPFVSKAAQKVEHDVTVSTIGDFLARASAAKAVIDAPTIIDVEVIEHDLTDPTKDR